MIKDKLENPAKLIAELLLPQSKSALSVYIFFLSIVSLYINHELSILSTKIQRNENEVVRITRNLDAFISKHDTIFAIHEISEETVIPSLVRQSLIYFGGLNNKIPRNLYEVSTLGEYSKYLEAGGGFHEIIRDNKYKIITLTKEIDQLEKTSFINQQVLLFLQFTVILYSLILSFRTITYIPNKKVSVLTTADHG